MMVLGQYMALLGGIGGSGGGSGNGSGGYLESTRLCD